MHDDGLFTFKVASYVSSSKCVCGVTISSPITKIFPTSPALVFAGGNVGLRLFNFSYPPTSHLISCQERKEQVFNQYGFWIFFFFV